MTISIRAALKNVASDNYDKKNIFIYFVLLFISGIIAGMLPQKLQNHSMTQSISALIYFCVFFLIIGINLIATKNAINNVPGVFPSLKDNIGKIIIEVLKYIVGCSITIFLPFFIIGIIFGIFGASNPLLGLVIILPILFFIYVWIGLYYNYIKSFEFSEWFNIKKALNFMNTGLGKFIIYAIKVIFLQIISFAITFSIVLILGGIIGVTSTILSPDSSKSAQLIVTYVSSLISTIIFGISAIYIVDLTGQFVRTVNAKLRPTKKKFIKTINTLNN